jgi:hypothetical protein
MNVVRQFENVNGKIDSAVLEVEGRQFLFKHHARTGEVRVSTWAPAFDGSPWDNPAEDVLAGMRADGRVERIYEGLSAAPDDRDVWRGGSLPVTFGV